MRRVPMHRTLLTAATLVWCCGWITTAAQAQLPMRVLGRQGDRVMLVGGDSLTPLDSLPPGEALPHFKRCDAPSPPLGAARGTGTVTYTLLADGTIDTSTVSAVEARGMSFPGVESAAIRVLNQCRFTPARLGGHAVPIRMAQIMKFATELPRIRSLYLTPRIADRGGTTTTMAQSGLGTDSTTVIYDAGSRDLDEGPLLLTCNTPTPLALSSMAATVRYVIGPDGAVDPAAVHISIDRSSASNSETDAYLRALAAHCRYAPARVLGRPVPMVMEFNVLVRQE